MAKLYFRYGAMNSGKTTALLMTAHNYKSQSKDVLILKPNIDTRNADMNVVQSRALSDAQSCSVFSSDENLFDLIREASKVTKIYAILVDEAQFMTATQVRDLARVVVDLEIPVICYGLRCRFTDGKLFEGSAALMYWADSIEEMKNICQYCKSKATKNLLRVNGVPHYSGEEVIIGDIEGESIVYTPVCLKHYFSPPK